MVVMSSSALQFRKYRDRVKKASFVLCQSCYWCATCFLADDGFPRCPACGSDVIDSIPISESEFYSVSVAGNGNVELRFQQVA